MEDYAKICRFGPQWGMLEHYIGKRTSTLPKNCDPVSKSQLKILEAENNSLKSTIYALNVEFL